MTTNVFTIRDDHRLGVAGEIMDWANVRHVPVVDRDNRLTGMLTHRDLLRVSLARKTPEAGDHEQHNHLMTIPITEVMSTDVRSIDPDATIQAATRLMLRGKYGALPVVDSRNRLLGILSESDLLRILECIDLDLALDRARG